MPSQIDSEQPAQGSPLSSAVVRQLAKTTKEEIEALQAKTLAANTQDGDYTAILTDTLVITSSASTASSIKTIPANSEVAFPVGKLLTFVNESEHNETVGVSDAMYLAGALKTAVTIPPHCSATALKVSATVWHISGGGLS